MHGAARRSHLWSDAGKPRECLAPLAAQRRLRIAILAEHRYLAQAQPRGMSAALMGEGHDVIVLDPQAYEVGKDLAMADVDLVVARGRSWTVLSLLGWAETLGRPILDPKSSVAAVHNKADMATTLADAGLPIPRTFVGAVADLAKQVPASCYPLILKPIFGDNGRGLRIVGTPGELKKLDWPEDTALAQHYLPNDGHDLKLYGIGHRIWAVRKISPLTRPGRAARPPELIPLTPALEDLGRRCGRLFGLHLYGVDCIETPTGPVVIEVNEFPNYTGVPDADQALARYAADFARGLS